MKCETRDGDKCRRWLAFEDHGAVDIIQESLTSPLLELPQSDGRKKCGGAAVTEVGPDTAAPERHLKCMSPLFHCILCLLF